MNSFVVLFLLFGLQKSVNCEGADARRPLKLLEELFAEQSSRSNTSTSLLKQETADEGGQEVKDNQQLGLILAELESQLLSRKQSQKFFRESSVHGLPGFDELRFRNNFVLSYDRRLKQPRWTLEHMCRDKLKYRFARRHKFKPYKEDYAIDGRFRSSNDDYRLTGYDRGQFAPVCDNMSYQEWLDQTFFYSNIAPQASHLNRGGCAWTRLEKYALFLARRSKNVYVLTGVAYMPENGKLTATPDAIGREKVSYELLGQNRVGVPSHFYKIILSEDHEDRFALEAFVVPNSNDVGMTAKFAQFKLDIDNELPELERSTGLKFFPLLDWSRVAKPMKFQYDYVEKFPTGWGLNANDEDTDDDENAKLPD